MKNIKIKIYFDDTIFVLQRIGGISIVFNEIINRIKNNSNLFITILINGNHHKNLLFKDLINGLHVKKELGINRFLLQFIPLLKILPKGSIYHSTYYRYSFQNNIKKVVTIHDLGYEKGIMQHGFKRIIHLFFKRMAIIRADAIICVSQNTKNDLEAYYSKLLVNKLVKVIYNGLSDAFLYNSELEVKKQKRYILYMGGRQKYKNFDKVVEVVKNLNDFDLLVCGGGEITEWETKLLKRNLNGRYVIKSGVNTDDLIKIYTQANCLIYPSSYEGFGLPMLEAMACGCPVIACDNSCVSEVMGGAGLLINEPDAEAITSAVLKLQNDETRAIMIKRGKENAKRFSWDKTVESTINLYKELLNI